MEYKLEGSKATITLPETLSQTHLYEFHTIVQRVLQNQVRTLYLDCGQVNLIDSMLTGALIKTLKNTRDNDCALVLINVSDENQATLEQSSLDKILTIQRGAEVTEAEPELSVTLQSEVKQNAVIVYFSGMMNGLDDSAKLKSLVQKYLVDYSRFIFDLSDAIYIDSLGVGEIVNVHRKIKQADGKLAFCGASEIVGDLFKGLGLLQIIPYYRHQEEALKHLA